MKNLIFKFSLLLLVAYVLISCSKSTIALQLDGCYVGYDIPIYFEDNMITKKESAYQKYCFDWNKLTYTVNNVDTSSHVEYSFVGKISVISDDKFQLVDSLYPGLDTIPNSYHLVRLWEITNRTTTSIDVHETQTWISNSNAAVVLKQNNYDRKLLKQ